MASATPVLLLIVLFNIYYISGRELDSVEEVNSTSASNTTNPLLSKLDKLIHGPKPKMNTLIENLPGESNLTDLLARNDSFNESTTQWFDQILLRRNESENNESTTLTESPESRFDLTGCDTHLRDKHEDDCFENFENFVRKSMEIEDEAEKGKQICCAAEGYERCCIIGYQQAGCEADHRAIKESLKAARMFMATLSDTSCSKHRGKCGFNSAVTRSPMSSFLLAALGFLPIVFLL